MADLAKRDKSRLLQLEKAGVLAAPIRVKVGRHQVRLYSPEEAAKIVAHFEQARPGRKPKRSKTHKIARASKRKTAKTELPSHTPIDDLYEGTDDRRKDVERRGLYF